MPNERILVAEDERDLRRMCIRALRMAGYEAVAVPDGLEAVRAAQASRFDVLVTDVRMPNLDGLEAYNQIRSSCPDLALVVMTGFGSLETAIQAIRLGVYEFVLKPFRPSELIAAVERALQRKRMQQEITRLNTLIPLLDLSKVFMTSVDLDAVPKHVVRIARQEVEASTASLMLLDSEGRLVVRSAKGEFPSGQTGSGPAVGEGTAGRAAMLREPVTVTGSLKDDPWAPLAFGTDVVAGAASVPLLHHDDVLGVLNVARFSGGEPLGGSDLEFLSVLASQAAAAIDNARLFAEIQDAYDRLSELDHLKSEFLNIAAHELRSPLSVVLAYATLLEDEATGPMRDHLAQVVQAAMQLKSTIDAMVSLQRIDTGQAKVVIDDVDLGPAIDAVLDDLRLLAQRRRQHVSVSLPDDTPPVRSDPQVLHLVLGSLVSNAIKFTPEEGSITVEVGREDDRVVVRVSDTGIGIPQEEQERIFERFYQVEDSLRRKHGGIGLGLAIAREMAVLINARIDVHSVVGEGSTFSLSLPAAGASPSD